MKTDVSAYGVTELSPEESSSTAGGFWPIVAIIAGVGALSVQLQVLAWL